MPFAHESVALKPCSSMVGSRSRCPFYGFRWVETTGKLIQAGNNECALEFDAHGPCVMEMAGKAVDYNGCPVAQHYDSFVEAAMLKLGTDFMTSSRDVS